MDFLIEKGVSPTIKNSRGFTALSLLAQGGSAERAIEIKDYAPQTSESHHPSGRAVCTNKTDIHPLMGEEDERERKIKWQNSMQKTLLVVATLLATMAYQASITPPGGLWQDTSQGNINNGTTQAPHNAGESIMGVEDPIGYKIFLVCNTISFVASLSVIMLLISGLPLHRRRITTWMPMLIMWVAITFTAATYAVSVSDFTPDDDWMTADKISEYGMWIWVGLMALILLCHVIRLIVKLVPGVLGLVRRAWIGSRQEEEQKKRPEP